MRTTLGRTAAICVAGLGLLIGVSALSGSASLAAPASSTSSSTSSSTTSTTTSSTSTTSTTSTTSSTSTTSTTTTTVPPLPVVEVPGVGATPERGTQLQVAATQPPPPTTTTLPPGWELPANSGSGRRIVYSKSRQRLWAIEADGTVAKMHLVSGRLEWSKPKVGTYSVFSRSAYTCNINNPHICWRYMVRFAHGPSGDNIGFHEIPRNLQTGLKLQSDSQIGLPLSGGCVRQLTSDAIFTWNWAPLGTKVVVTP